jgi:murein DD-endopeptidase MepM/ murein hydrolase activator NlpD
MATVPFRRFRPLGAFAIDFMRLDAQNRLFVGDPTKASDYVAYGAPMRVVAASDHLPDQVPLSPKLVSSAEADGNFIMLDLDNGRYANYAHLKPGIIIVKVGDRVKAGQQFALVGNSGQTGDPHLHFHVMDRPLLAEANGLPYEFKGFTVTGIADLDSIDRAISTGSETEGQASRPRQA